MAPHTPKASPNSTEAANMFDILARNDGFWWPYRTLSKVLLQTQRNAIGYLEANHRLLDAAQRIIRAQQDLASEISEAVLNAMVKSGNPQSERALDPSEVNQIFDRAVTGLRELNQAWIDAQTHSLDSMRS